MPKSQTKVGERMAAAFKAKAAQYGNDLTINGQKCKGFSRSIERGDSSFLPDGTTNAAFPNLCAYMIAPDAVAVPPAADQKLVDSGRTYTVITVPRPERISSIPVYQTLYVYSAEAAAGSLQDDDQAAQWPAPPP